jgi:hypothetical protein
MHEHDIKDFVPTDLSTLHIIVGHLAEEVADLVKELGKYDRND